MKTKFNYFIGACILFTLCSTNLLSQNLSINWGPDITTEGKQAISYDQIIHEDKTTSITMKFEGILYRKCYIVKKKKADDSELASFDLAAYMKKLKAISVATEYLDNQLVIFYRIHHKREKKIKLFAQKFNNQLEPENEPVLIMSNMFLGSNPKFCMFILRKYKNKILINYDEYGIKAYAPPSVSFTLIGNDLKVYWETSFPIEMSDGDFIGVDHASLVEDEQNLIALIKLDNKDKGVYKLFKYYPGSGKQEMRQVNLEKTNQSIYAYNLTSTVNIRKKTINLTCLYSTNKHYEDGLDGILSIDYNLENITENKSLMIPFQNKLLNKIMSQKEVEKNVKPKLKLRKSFVDSEGEMLLILEEQESSSVRLGDRNITTSTFGDIVIMKFNLNEDVIWDRVISKEQSGSNSLIHHFASIVSIYENNYLYLLFNTQTDLLDKNEYNLNNLSNPISLALIVIDGDGEIVKEQVVQTPNATALISYFNKTAEDGKYHITAERISLPWGESEQKNIGEIIID